MKIVPLIADSFVSELVEALEEAVQEDDENSDDPPAILGEQDAIEIAEEITKEEAIVDKNEGENEEDMVIADSDVRDETVTEVEVENKIDAENDNSENNEDGEQAVVEKCEVSGESEPPLLSEEDEVAMEASEASVTKGDDVEEALVPALEDNSELAEKDEGEEEDTSSDPQLPPRSLSPSSSSSQKLPNGAIPSVL